MVRGSRAGLRGDGRELPPVTFDDWPEASPVTADPAAG
eukprot:CAMPEP_0168496292 /NCGR_PEP_ID=MMETSP0228-20121227/72186_1 /TAXON_ID=133427 /ORGANISM="Protoceratium reticulatum, Strain CCCM 535 (=CCMP 1889)" /LENGTH=37 /DNA_ID= /DNA_START= /DNA_END= /DNA_ORIENTATION=